jgi:hypothetical protein
MGQKTLTAIIAGAITMLSAPAASQELARSSSYTPARLDYALPAEKYALRLQPPSRGGSLIDALANLYEQSGLGKRRTEKLRLKAAGLPDFEPASTALIPRKAGKAGKHFPIGGHGFRLYAEAYIIRNPWTRERKAGFQLAAKIEY